MHTVLIIEDNFDLADLMQMQLRIDGCEAHVVESRDQALDFMQQHGVPDTIIMDWHMPGMGVERFLFELASMNPRLPRLILSTAGNDADAAARHYNIPEVLRKPFDVTRLMEHVDGCK